jgi:hypothetical protein
MNFKKFTITHNYCYHTDAIEINSKSTCNGTHDTFQVTQTCIKYIIKHINDTYILAGVNPPTACRPSQNLPALDLHCSSLSAVGHPRAGTKLHRAREF